MSDLAAKLRRLRRDVPRASESVAARIARVGQVDGTPAEIESRRAQAERKTMGDPAGLEVGEAAVDPVFYREESFAEQHLHGDWQLLEVDHACSETLGFLARDPACSQLDLRRAVYLDVETTGLSGGAGTISFLVALGSFESGEFRLWQGFLRSPAEEAAMLAEVARRIAAADSVVSFFGKSFDRHRLQDKMKLHGIESPFDSRPHLDLYWPLQRLYGRVFGDGRLGTMEARLTGVRREDDLPGSFAPEAWFDYLGGRGHRLEDVFRHNRDDVLSLVVLAAHAGRSLVGKCGDGRPLSGPEGPRAAGLGRLYAKNGQSEPALDWCRRALAAGGVPDEGGLRLTQAKLLVRSGDARSALAAFLDLAGDAAGHSARGEVSAAASIEAAKLLEHSFRDPRAALAACSKARALALEELTGRARARILQGLDRREGRLARKLDSARN